MTMILCLKPTLVSDEFLKLLNAKRVEFRLYEQIIIVINSKRSEMRSAMLRDNDLLRSNQRDTMERAMSDA